MVRMVAPYKFSFTKVISFQGAANDLYKSTYVNKIGSTQLSLTSILMFLWVTVSAVLIIRFICQYKKVIKILIYLYWCIFWWNPAIYLLKKDLSQIIEIKCDLDVVEKMSNDQKVAYLSTIVTMLKNASTNSTTASLYGTTALVSKKYEREVIERFKIVSGYEHHRKNILFTELWFLIFFMLIFASYSFVIQLDFKIMSQETLCLF